MNKANQNNVGGVGRHAKKGLDRETEQREKLTQKYVVEEDLGVFWD
jgi:hypothetical protein